MNVKLFKEIAELEEPRLRRILFSLMEEMDRQREWERKIVTKSEFNELKAVVQQLAEAQKRTEERLNELAKRVDELAEAQKRTEEAVQRLTGEMAFVKERLEGLSHTIGYTLENKSYKALPELLKRDFGIELTTKLVRKYISISPKKRIQVNIYGHGKMDGKEVVIYGECKVRASRSEIRRFIKHMKTLEEIEGKQVVPVIVAHDFTPEMEEFLRKEGIKYYWSYELD